MTTAVETETKRGFVCPDRLVNEWNARECSIAEFQNGDFGVVDTTLSVIVYLGAREDCYNFLSSRLFGPPDGFYFKPEVKEMSDPDSSTTEKEV